ASPGHPEMSSTGYVPCPALSAAGRSTDPVPSGDRWTGNRRLPEEKSAPDSRDIPHRYENRNLLQRFPEGFRTVRCPHGPRSRCAPGDPDKASLPGPPYYPTTVSAPA